MENIFLKTLYSYFILLKFKKSIISLSALSYFVGLQLTVALETIACKKMDNMISKTYFLFVYSSVGWSDFYFFDWTEDST